MLVVFSGCGITKKTVEESVPVEPEIAQTKTDTVETDSVKEALFVKPFTTEDIPETPREFRGVWVATVANIDWPSKPGLPVAQQKAELIAIMEQAAALNLNAVIMQVRPSADAFYDSPYEPWSFYLTGKQGRAPEPYYDPLKFAIKQAHKRGLELHAWFNPFRAYHPAAPTNLAKGHIKNVHPEWVVQYGNYYWLNPGVKQVRQYSLKVILDVVRRYDIDGVHLDDYFYPYPSFDDGRNPIPFPDDAAYNTYLKTNERISSGDWRRQNVNKFVKKLSAAIQKTDSTLLFGISPFGIWRPGYPSQVVGLDAYKYIYADSRKWLRRGWVDYLAPQLYWAIDNEGQRFPKLLKWWHRQNYSDRYIWPGLYTSNIDNYPEYGFPSTEIINQIHIIRNMSGVSGQIHFSMKALMQNYGEISKELISEVYRAEALVPAVNRQPHKLLSKPTAKLIFNNHDYVVKFLHKNDYQPWLWVIKTKYGDTWNINIYSGDKKKIRIPQKTQAGYFIGAAVSAVNKKSAESKAVLLFPLNYRAASNNLQENHQS